MHFEMGIKEQIHELYGGLLADKELFRWLLDPSGVLNNNLIKIMQEDPEKYRAAERLKIIFKHIKIEEENLTEEARRELWGKIEAFIDKQETKRRRIRFFVRYVAAFLVLAGFSAGYFMFRNGDAKVPPVDYEEVLSGAIPAMEGSSNIILIMSDNERIEIAGNKVQLRYDADGRIYADSVLLTESVYTKQEAAGMNKLYVPYGKTMNIFMSDGTKVWVNSGSKVVFPPLFAHDKREVFVDGEMYLEVAPKKETPFTVKTGLLDVEVLGTSFNVSAYSCDDGQSVVLASGSVSVKDTKWSRPSVILPNQKYIYEKSNNSFHLQDVNALDYTCWRFGYLSLHKEQLKNILKRIERFYNVRIDYVANRVDHTVLGGKLDLKENIEETFRILA
ncbi:MAG: FecR domain-containing protein, partial [Tannerellaceae bacterium]|nr:FecR domain-containing protein [Tannerellaceae bacterium]